MQRAEAHRVIFGDDAASVPGGNHAKAQSHQARCFRAGLLRAIAKPNHWTLGFGQNGDGFIQFRRIGRQWRRDGQHQRIQPSRARNGRALQINRDFN